MNNFLCKRLSIASCIITLTTQTILADIHKTIGDLTKKPSAVCSHIQTPFKKFGNKIEPWIPDAHADITLPLASCILTLIARQIVPAVAKTKNIHEHTHVKAGITTLNLGLGIAIFHDTWTRGVEADGTLKDPIDWTLKNSLSGLMIATNAYTLYKLNCPETKRP